MTNAIKTSSLPKPSRNAKGMIFATADLLIIIPFVVAGCLVLIDASLTGFYKQRLSTVLAQAAQHAANLPPGQDPVAPTESLVQQLVTASNLKISNLKVTVKPVEVETCKAVQVTASGVFPLLEGSALPVSIPLQDTSVALIPPNRVCALIAITPGSYAQQYPSRGPSVYIPVVQPTNNLPIWSFPYATAISSVSVERGASPTLPPPQPSSNKNYFEGRESLY